MVVYSFYIFDRHTECIYTRRWTPIPATTASKAVIGNGDAPTTVKKGLSKEDDAKLIFGTIFSLRRLAQQLGGDDNEFLSYRTGEYKLHYFETPTKLKFVMITDTKTQNLRVVLHQIWASLYVEYVVKNPLSPAEHTGGIGVANLLFESGLDSFVNTYFSS